MHEDSKRDDEGRLVELSADDIKVAKRLLLLLSDVNGQTPFRATEVRGWETRSHLVHRARDMLRDRQLRMQQFDKAIFGEPAWDILLVLYASENGPRQTINRLVGAIGSSRTTALRWLDYLERQELVRRESHPTDRRTAFFELTEKGTERLDQYFTQILAKSDSS